MAQKQRKASSGGFSRGERSRDRILHRAIRVVSEQGWEALTIGRLAAGLGMSKSGLFVHFGSKQKLQLATIIRARQIFEEQVLRPQEASPKGIGRLWGLCDLWLRHLEDRVFPSGYFFTGAILEYGERNGPLPSVIRAVALTWLQSLQRAARESQKRKELQSEPHADAMAWELNALLVGAYCARLAGYGGAYSEARVAILDRLREWATAQIPSQTFQSVRRRKKYLARTSSK